MAIKGVVGKMKALLISIRPQWVEKILNLIKKDEIRKGTALYKAINKLITKQGVAPMLIYCSKDNKKHLYPVALLDKSNHVFKRAYREDKIDNRTNYLNGKVVACFNATAEEINTTNELGYVRYDTNTTYGSKLRNWACLTYDELHNYLQGEKGTAIHITNLEIFDKPKEISEFRQWFDCEKCWCIDNQDCLMNKQCPKHSLTRAPQSWCYIEI